MMAAIAVAAALVENFSRAGNEDQLTGVPGDSWPGPSQQPE